MKRILASSIFMAVVWISGYILIPPKLTQWHFFFGAFMGAALLAEVGRLVKLQTLEDKKRKDEAADTGATPGEG
jgi:uncharacterized membrane protein YhfC